MAFDYYFGAIDEIEFEFDAFDHLGNAPSEEDSWCLEKFFRNIHTYSLKPNEFDYVTGDIWNIYVCGYIVEVRRLRRNKVVVTRVYPGITSNLPSPKKA
jgi:hypothetical protein